MASPLSLLEPLDPYEQEYAAGRQDLPEDHLAEDIRQYRANLKTNGK
jgi:hypothetical protein